VLLIGDQSGSMSLGNSETTGETLWETQRKVTFLILSALHSFEKKLRNASLSEDTELAVRTGAWSFGTEGWDTPVIKNNKPFSNEYNELDQVRLWHGLTGTRGGNADVEALQEVYLSIIRDQEARKAAGDNKQRSRIVISCSDGAPESPAKVRAWAYFIGLTGVEGEKPLEFVETKKETEEGEGVVSYNLTPESQTLFQDKVKEMARLIAQERTQGSSKAKVSKKSSATHIVGVGVTESGKGVEQIYDSPCSTGAYIKDVNQLAALVGEVVVRQAIELLPADAREESSKMLKQYLALLASGSS